MDGNDDNDDSGRMIDIDATVRHLEVFLNSVLSAEKDAAVWRSAAVTEWMDTAEARSRVTKEADDLYVSQQNESKHRAAVAMLGYMQSLDGNNNSNNDDDTKSEEEALLLGEALHQSAPFQELSREFPIPKIFDKPTADILSFTKYVLAQKRRVSRAAAVDTATELVRKHYEANTLARSTKGQQAAAALEARLETLVEGHKNWLARSDHEPIRARIRSLHPEVRDSSSGGKATSTPLRVASHNVQERVTNGVRTYACHMPFLAGLDDKGASKTLMAMMLQPAVTTEHVRQVMSLVERELFVHRSADAVCLQELSLDMANELQRTYGDGGGGGGGDDKSGKDGTARRTWVHVSSLTNANNSNINTSSKRAGECSALTCIISVLPFVPLRDVTVVTQQASKSVVRNYAAVLLMPPGEEQQDSVALCSVHVRHAATSRNNVNIDSAMKVLIDLLDELVALEGERGQGGSLARGGKIAGLLAVGDFNGPVERSYNALHPQRASSGLCVLATRPGEPTAYAGTMRNRDYCIDGAIWISRMSDEGATCTVIAGDNDDARDMTRRATTRAVSSTTGVATQREWELTCGLISRPP